MSAVALTPAPTSGTACPSCSCGCGYSRTNSRDGNRDRPAHCYALGYCKGTSRCNISNGRL
ncbi:hypothetical protein BGY98DRAFT_996421 [Russula aff. rugulosa BPL654]|nr:hypothetical protein BGY98DRAFT_996421 [Russula aff. rugulosa BPL654]